ncbi:alpha/beta hydrolase [Altererythrobacter arenosus]|uniref:Alpha/beta hydrolase n=1 Tax=Altererythrobacter arenosus TaxID=3032592 RepID=A0ABY8G1H6_9SPHN|nr:alpha/beta hydrolase [Altererythrobacter sp. CAU 1644]WFL78379.1 alpha/beta hydrolase [Altererythrobacter sp. CAU 1644]
MPQLTANGITIEYDERGNPSDPTMLMIMGVGAQMTFWPDELLDELAGHGFRVIRFDNRDIGLSHKFHGVKSPGILKLLIWDRLRLPINTPYSLSDMADDAIGVLDALAVERAHVVGASMGGMIAQHAAIRHPERLRSLTSVMSTTGHRRLPPAGKHAMRALTRRPSSMEEDALVAHGKMVARAIGSPGFPPDEGRLEERVRANVRRSVYPEGFIRQMGAIVADGDRRERLRQVKAPTLVLHGDDDPLIPVAHAHDTAAHIPQARLVTFPGWGHDLPLAMVEPVARTIAEHARSVESERAAAA